MNFNKRIENGKTIIEGSGQLKVVDAVRTSSFKYSRQYLSKESHGEDGIVCTLHANFDPSAVVSEIKFTTKEALFFGSYCEKSKDCTQMKLHSKLDTDSNYHLKWSQVEALHLDYSLQERQSCTTKSPSKPT